MFSFGIFYTLTDLVLTNSEFKYKEQKIFLKACYGHLNAILHFMC